MDPACKSDPQFPWEGNLLLPTPFFFFLLTLLLSHGTGWQVLSSCMHGYSSVSSFIWPSVTRASYLLCMGNWEDWGDWEGTHLPLLPGIFKYLCWTTSHSHRCIYDILFPLLHLGEYQWHPLSDHCHLLCHLKYIDLFSYCRFHCLHHSSVLSQPIFFTGEFFKVLVTALTKLLMDQRSYEFSDSWRSNKLLWLLGSLYQQLLHKASFHFLVLEALSKCCFLKEVEGLIVLHFLWDALCFFFHNLHENEWVCVCKYFETMLFRGTSCQSFLPNQLVFTLHILIIQFSIFFSFLSLIFCIIFLSPSVCFHPLVIWQVGLLPHCLTWPFIIGQLFPCKCLFIQFRHLSPQ